MNIILGCEESQAVCIEFRKRGHNAFSCDLQPCSGGYNEWHIQDDLLVVIKRGVPGGGIWHRGIFFPPCTDIAVSGAAHFEIKKRDGRQQKAIDFFMSCINAPIDEIAVENPISIMSSIYRPPDQIINPYYFGDNVPKKTCLWLKNLPKLVHIKQDDLFSKKTHVEPEHIEYNSLKTKSGKSYYSVFGKLGKGHGKERSKTFSGIARAMAEQWG